MKVDDYGIKAIRFISVSIIVVIILVYSSFAISAIGKNLNDTVGSSIISSEAERDESNYGIINEVQKTVSIDCGSDLINKSRDGFTSQYIYSRDFTYVTSRCPGGFIWMSVEDMKSEINTMELKRYYDEIDSGTHSVPVYHLNPDVFYDIISIIKKYDWKEHKEHINAYELSACEITIVGKNTVYTYLIFGRDKSGRGFVWSFYDYKIAYLSQQDFESIENTFSQIQ